MIRVIVVYVILTFKVFNLAFVVDVDNTVIIYDAIVI